MNTLSIVSGANKPELLKEETLIDIFSATAKNFPDKIALIFKDQTFTYQQLDEWSSAVAANLQQKGLQKGGSCLIWWPRSIELHVAIIAIVKCGAAYVPMDFDMPEERVLAVLNDTKASHCITFNNLQADCSIVHQLNFLPEDTASYTVPNLLPDDTAYMLFTSGSTGKPKGIPISHRNICHLIRSENDLLGINSSDKVYQGFSVSFDMWCEESWVSYLVGATIWIADAITAKSIDELSEILLKEKITVLHAVPSLLAVMDDIELPLLRLVNAGGEACTQQVLNKWSAPGRQFFNSYGPTETTVSATFAPLSKGEPITIGKPLPNYALAVVNEAMHPVAIGKAGELIVTGVGVSKGYWNLPALTAEKFIPKNEQLSSMPGDTIYRTGDAAFMDEKLDIHFVGRIDDQVKLRGYRIELGEIESLLSHMEGVLQAAVALKKDYADQDQLTAYVQMNKQVAFDEAKLKDQLAEKLPNYMVPFVIVSMDEMPRLPSGKIDRKKLPVPDSYLEVKETIENSILTTDTVAVKVQKGLSTIFNKPDVLLTQDFFDDLGGHSLLAATFISKMRKEAGLTAVSLKDIYLHRPLQALVNKWEEKAGIKTESTPFIPIPKWRYYTCWLAQTVAVFIIYGLFATEIFIPYLGYYYTQINSESHLFGLIAALLIFCTLPPLFTGFGIAAKWLIIGKYKEGEYPMWGSYYFKWWLVNTIQKLMPTQFLNGTPLYPKFFKWLGVKISPDAQLSAITIGAEDLVEIGEDVSISSYVNINNAVVENGLFKLTKVKIGNHAYIGSSAVVGGNTVIEDWGELQDLSYLPQGQKIGYAEIWKGSPAKKIYTRTPNEFTQPIEVSKATIKKYNLIYTFSLALFPMFVLIPLIPTIIALSELDSASNEYDFTYVWLTPILTIIYLLLFAAENIVLTWLLQRDLKPGTYPVYSWFYFKKWLVDQMNTLSLIVLHPLYATMFISSYFRALGAKIGKRTEISTASSVTHPLLEIGDGSFIADAVTLGEADVRGQQLILEKTTIANSSFVGNSALIPQGYQLGSNMLIGVLSTPPTKEQLQNQPSQNWFGSPAIAMPKRQDSKDFDASLTFNPTKRLIAARSSVELVRIILPQTIVLICSVFFIGYGSDMLDQESVLRIFILSPIYYLVIMGLPAFFVTVILKWLIVGRYTAFTAPMWSWKVWSSEFITSTYEALAIPFFLEYLIGTPWLPFMLRFLGVKTGKRIYMNTADITEYDMVTIEDDVAMNEDCGPQTHLFEDRVMKVGHIKIGARSSIGSRSIILYDSEIGTDVKLAPLSLVMKGETIPGNTSWGGSPVTQL
jgi:non-ribosomal peptide synthetase-like protein